MKKLILMLLLPLFLIGCNIGDEFLPSGASYIAGVRTFFRGTDGVLWDNDDFICEGGFIYARGPDRLADGNIILDNSGTELECSPDLTWEIVATKV